MAVLGAALAAAGCLTRVHTTFEPLGPLAAVRAQPATMRVSLDRGAAGPPAARLDYRSRVGGYEVYRLSFPSSGFNRQNDNLLRARYYRREGPGRRGVVVLLPIWGHSFYPPTIAARRLLRRGAFHVVVVEGERRLLDWGAADTAADPEAYRRQVRRWVATLETTIEDVRRMLDWVVARLEIDRRSVGLVGFSMSAILGATVAGRDPRVTHGVFVMGGGRLEEIFAACEGLPGRVRERLLERFGWSTEDLEAFLAPEVAAINPVTWAPRLDPRRLLVIDAGRDRCVPQSSRDGLWEAMGRPERITIQSGHNASFLSLTFLDNFRATKDIARFFHRQLRPESPPVALAAGSS